MQYFPFLWELSPFAFVGMGILNKHFTCFDNEKKQQN
jgi:hypothetical protein